jgi:hypothetical protein
LQKQTAGTGLSARYKNNPVERRQNCINIVGESAQIVANLVKKYSIEEINV